ncbi:uncharacterized protein LOC115630470 [Scaptodrosophila lebanonensis]|uniref:Uncharacterized protein LOC115630470 n=1 Tax=Drosophila lebanonensis TaxID=7225 RepID=A0A6J2U2N0_DROLE|nr:uncharacterized protein LOC115630470 [Scaptodrosophila lebanonensis]
MLRLTRNTIFCLIMLDWLNYTLAAMSMNNYGDNAYPDRCVLDIADQVVLLQVGEMYKFESLPCTSIYCLGDGWGMLQTCDHVKPKSGCRFTEYVDLRAPFPECCKRRVFCD